MENQTESVWILEIHRDRFWFCFFYSVVMFVICDSELQIIWCRYLLIVMQESYIHTNFPHRAINIGGSTIPWALKWRNKMSTVNWLSLCLSVGQWPLSSVSASLSSFFLWNIQRSPQTQSLIPERLSTCWTPLHPLPWRCLSAWCCATWRQLQTLY